jgi:tetratricopeptide (TPR) repeat protein
MHQNSADDLPRRIGDLLEKATHCNNEGRFQDTAVLVDEARRLATDNIQALAEIDLFCAVALLEQGHREQGLQALGAILVKHDPWLNTAEGRPVYEAIQVHKAFSRKHLQKNLEAKPLLEEATQFELGAEVRSDVHCHLGCCYHELGLYTLAREQFERANALGVSEDWESVFHYYYGYTLYELTEFQQAKREFILCLQSGSSGPEPTLRHAMLAAVCRKLGEHSEAAAFEQQAKSLKS